jgi:hypothetical protein
MLRGVVTDEQKRSFSVLEQVVNIVATGVQMVKYYCHVQTQGEGRLLLK